MEFYVLIGKGFSFACWLFHVKEVGEIEALRTEEREKKKENTSIRRKTILLVSFFLLTCSMCSMFLVLVHAAFEVRREM